MDMSKKKMKTWYNGINWSVALALALGFTGMVLGALAISWMPPRDQIEDRMLQATDNTTQVLALASTWQDINYAFTVRLKHQNSGGTHNGDLDVGGVVWKHYRGSPRFKCHKDGVYTFTLSTQAGLVTPPTAAPSAAPTVAPTVAPTAKKRDVEDTVAQEQGPTAAPTLIPLACNDSTIIYFIRAVQQYREFGNWYEVFGSNTFGTSRMTYLSKTFLVDARSGDHIKFQFMSACQYVALTPVALNAPLIGALDWHEHDDDWRLGKSFPTSSTVVIG